VSDLNDIFEKDPLSLTTEDIDALIARYRQARTQWKAGGEKAPKEKKEKIELKLDDLKDLLK